MNRPPLRRLVRTLRDSRVVGPAVRAADRLWWWRVIRRSGLVDARFYATQLGVRALSTDLAIAHYVIRGFRRGLSLNPLFDEITAGGHLPEVFRVPALYAYLLSDRVSVPVHPLWDAPAYGRGFDDGRAPLEHAWETPDREVVLTAGPRSRRVSVSTVRAEAIEAARTWRRSVTAAARTGETDGASARAGILRVVQKRDRRYGLKLAQAARFADRDGVRVTVALVSPDASQWVAAMLLRTVDQRIVVEGRRATEPWARLVQREASRSDAEVFVALDARAEFADVDVDRMVDAAAAGFAVAPVHLAQDGTVDAAGAAVIRGFETPYRVLTAHPPEDLRGWGAGPVEVPLLSGRSFAAPRPALAGSVSGDDLDTVALEAWTYRLRRAGMRAVVLPDVRPVLEEPEYAFGHRGRPRRADARLHGDDGERAAELLSLSLFAVEGWSRGDAGPVPALRWQRPAPGAQRWAIKICAPPGRPGAVWGDTHFAVGLARALRRRGHDVVIDAFGASRRASAYLDDVSVAIRGPYRIDPPDTGVRIEWIISHPDDVSADEVGNYDAVFAASRRWSADASARWNRPVRPLLECTDVDQFHPRGLERGDDIVFVGTARGIARPSVVAPLAAGIPVKVYGPDWRPFIPTSAVVAETIPNSELPARYETASIVLNDQWPAMRRHGFIAMRPFDAVAVGARVISEDVDEIEEIFRGAVVTYRDAAHLVELLSADPSTIFPPDDQLAKIAEYVRAEHSFDARAAVLADAVSERAHPPVTHSERG